MAAHPIFGEEQSPTAPWGRGSDVPFCAYSLVTGWARIVWLGLLIGPFLTKDNIVRFIVNSSPLLLYELNILRVSSPSSEVQQRIITKNIR